MYRGIEYQIQWKTQYKRIGERHEKGCCIQGAQYNPSPTSPNTAKYIPDRSAILFFSFQRLILYYES